MHWIDGTVVGAYLLATLGLGYWLSRRIESPGDYFLAGRDLSFWAVGMSLVVSDIGALEMVGGTAAAYRYGLAQANFEWLGCVPAMIIGALVFAPALWRSGVYSVPEYLGLRYGPTVRGLQALIWISFLSAGLGVFFQASAEMLGQVLGWSRMLSVFVTASVVAAYTIGGGLKAVVTTDVIQCGALFVGGLALSAAGLSRAGGIPGLRESLSRQGPATARHLRLMLPARAVAGGATPGYPWTGVVFGLGLVLSPAYWLGNQAIVQRVLGTRDEWSSRASMVFGAGLKTIVPLAFVLPGLLAYAVLPEAGRGQPPGRIYPALIEALLPVGLRGVMYAAFLAALMSSVDSYTNSAATIFSRDIYQRFLAPGRPDAHYLRVGRLASLTVITLGVAMVPLVASFPTIYDAFQTYLSYFQGPTLVLLLGAVAWRRASRAGGIATLVGGTAAAAWLHAGTGMHFLHLAWWSFVVSGALLITVSLHSGPPSPAGGADDA